MEIYTASDDSFFFAEFLKDYFSSLTNKNIKYLDMGTGSGILSETALEKGIKKSDILASDINKSSVNYVKNNLKIKTIHSDLFASIPKKDRWDLITFNAPYLPEDEQEPKDSRTATTGGKKGDEISLKFLKQAKEHLNKNGKIFLLISSLTPLIRIKKFKPEIVARKKIFMEELLILGFNFS